MWDLKNVTATKCMSLIIRMISRHDITFIHIYLLVFYLTWLFNDDQWYLWWGRRNVTSKGSTTIDTDSQSLPSGSSDCHNIRGSIPGGKHISSSDSSCSIVLEMLNVFVIVTKAGLDEPHGTNLLRAQSLRESWSLFSVYPLDEGGLKGFLKLAAASFTEYTRGNSDCLFTSRFPLIHCHQKK